MKNLNHNVGKRQFIGTMVVTAAAAAAVTTGLIGCGSTDAVKPTATQMLSMSATEQVAAIKAGAMSALDLTNATLDQVAAKSALNAMISVDAAAARAQASKIDAQRANGQTLASLAGLPIVVKDNINSAGFVTTGGTLALATNKPAANAPSLQKLIDAGAVVIGKSNMHELAFGITSTNAVQFAAGSGLSGGAVGNAYNPAMIPGGSSGGTATAIAARLVSAGLGTDTGGSTRVPAALSGIVGFRPSVGNGGAERRYTNTNAVVPISSTRDTIGPMARTVADVALLDGVITGQVTLDTVSLSGLRLGIPTEMWQNLDPALKTVVDAAKAKLVQAGVVFVDVSVAALIASNNNTSFQIALHEPVVDIPAYLNATQSPVRTVAALAAGIASKDVQGAFGAIAGDVFGGAYPAAMATHRPAMQAFYANLWTSQNIKALFFPTTPLAAIAMDMVNGSDKTTLNGASVDTFGTFIRNTDPASNAGIPGLSIPAGLTASGLPVGVEIDGPLGSDRDLLAIGIAIEKVLGSVPAPK